ncbi:MAG: MBL fold metallo-hydrolase [Bacteroidales bacterium]|nr:MBL fold metallo-hydrolase [Candidatus Physcousia equi]
MEIKSFTVNPLQVNCYALCQDGECALIDCGALEEQEWAPIKAWIDAHGGRLKYVLQTHMHFDHIFGLQFAFRDYGARARCHAADTYNYTHAQQHIEQMFGMSLPLSLPALGEALADGDIIELGSQTIEVMHTPGHTPGGICFYAEKEGVLFSGDTLFQGSVGRADLPGGNMHTELQSIRQRILVLPDATQVLPGHGPKTNVAEEKRHNMYL